MNALRPSSSSNIPPYTKPGHPYTACTMKFGPALVLILPVAALPQDLPPGHFPSGFIGFTATCQQTRLDRRNGELVIQAVCPDEAGARITSSVPINACIINEGGSIRCERNGGLSCRASSAQGVTSTPGRPGSS